MGSPLLAGFTEFMDSGVLLWIGLAACGVWLAYILLITAHELGHAVAGLLLTSDPVSLRVGRMPGLIHGRIGRLEIHWDMRPGETQHDEHDGDLSLGSPLRDPTKKLLFVLAGPFANLVLALVLVPTYLALSGIAQVSVGVTIAASLLMAAWSLRPAATGSDGYEAVMALRERRSHA